LIFEGADGFMDKEKKKPGIKVLKDGPYRVVGNIPLREKIIIQKGKCNEYEEGRELPQAEEYLLCRCGKSKNKPFCDGTHARTGFDGTETASRDKYDDRAQYLEGPGVDMRDDNRCALARFCHREDGNAWDLLEKTGEERYKSQVVRAASDCPAGRLTAIEKDGEAVEPELEPSIAIIQDPEKEVSAGIYVQGYIPLESADGDAYELRNRYALCRCGHSKNKPFCDISHVAARFSDKEQ
jgi:CDGSH-type Zn-finger protein